ncbi:Chromosome partition protein Smc [Rubripirellula lacrimiformis]|uniref:Chromosome partition protein Smc n=1 Tax=Rubripirellula lacrimiformis TaxID=1930273 RepID=A0A517NAT8_9BACT|nr:hypothetical protein [Rubripirellula lacrimiformis]QDT04240.1 Chromosome partition protein Smc [Rubripirellula lacrimiformis]
MNTFSRESDDQSDDESLLKQQSSRMGGNDHFGGTDTESMFNDPPLITPDPDLDHVSTQTNVQVETSSHQKGKRGEAKPNLLQRAFSRASKTNEQGITSEFPSTTLFASSLVIFTLVLIIQIVALRSHLSVMEDQIERDATLENYEQIQNDYQKQVGSWKKLTSAQLERLETQRSELAMRESQISKLSLSEKESQKRTEEAKQLMETTLAELKIARDDLAVAEASLQVTKARQLVLKNETGELQRGYTSAKAEITETEKLLEQSAAQLANNIAELKRQETELKSNNDRTTMLATAKIELAGVKQQTENARNILADIQSEAKRLSDRREQLVLDLEKLELRRNAIENELAAASRESSRIPVGDSEVITNDPKSKEESIGETDAESALGSPNLKDATEDQQ